MLDLFNKFTNETKRTDVNTAFIIHVYYYLPSNISILSNLNNVISNRPNYSIAIYIHLLINILIIMVVDNELFLRFWGGMLQNSLDYILQAHNDPHSQHTGLSLCSSSYYSNTGFITLAKHNATHFSILCTNYTGGGVWCVCCVVGCGVVGRCVIAHGVLRRVISTRMYGSRWGMPAVWGGACSCCSFLIHA